jgi:peptidoglycan/LPS O-acetylase OafA/YrhL
MGVSQSHRKMLAARASRAIPVLELHEEATAARDYRADIDGLRAVAVALVVAFHAFPRLVPGGFVGVDVFFVISGYLISGNILSKLGRGRFTVADFYIRRARRILPALVLVLAATLLIGRVILVPPVYQRLGLEALSGALFVPNFVFWHQAGYFDAAAETKPLLHLWSLGVEEQFYLLWPILLMILSRRPSHLLAVLSAIVAASLAYSCYAAIYSPAEAFYAPWSRLWELGSGGILFLVARHRRDNDVLSAIGLVLILASAFLLRKSSTFPGFAAIPAVAGSAFVIASGSRVLARKLPELLGRISYPLYLWHWPLLVFAGTNGMNSIWHRAIIIAISVVLSILTYQLLEKPIRFGRLQRAGVIASFAMMIAVAGVSLLALYDRRIPDRYSSEIGPVLALANYKPETDARFPSCWVSETVPFEAFGEECRKGTTLIWGDSHAARLYTGFKPIGIEAAQFTRNGCMPSLETERRSLCDESNASIIREIRRLKPSRVIVFAAWPYYNGVDWQLGNERVESIRRAIESLRQTVGDVVMLGPAPSWFPDLPTVTLQYWDKNRRLPDRIPATANHYRAIDAILAGIAQQHGARFISVYDTLCNVNGCLTHTATSKSDLLTFDYGHLSTSGAKYVLHTLHLDQPQLGSLSN